jgi:HEAT repeat protein
MPPALHDLIRRMSTREVRVDSAQSVSWQAHREAEQVADPTIRSALEAFLATGKSKDERKAVYFLLGALGANASDVRCAIVLSNYIPEEQDKYVLSTILEALAKITKPKDFPLDNVFHCLSDKRWLVRHAAIQALRTTDSADVEDRLLQHLSSFTEPFDMIYCHVTLGGVGSAKSLPALTQNLRSRKRDVRMSAEAAIRGIEGRIAMSEKSGTA